MLAFDRRQRGTFNKSFEQYAATRVGAAHQARAIDMLQQHASLLSRIERQFGVPATLIVAIWTLETDNGSGDMGKLPVVRTLATLAHDCRRTELFQGELLAALKIVQRGDLPLRDLIGAYAGEIGQTQFLPSSYIKYGVDYDGNGHVDLRHSVPDVLASTANLLKINGWKAGAPYGEGTAEFRGDARVEPVRDLSQDAGPVRREAGSAVRRVPRRRLSCRRAALRFALRLQRVDAARRPGLGEGLHERPGSFIARAPGHLDSRYLGTYTALDNHGCALEAAMRGGVFGLLLGVCLTCAAHAEPLTPKAFTDEVVRNLAPKVLGGGIAVKGELSLLVTRPGGGELTVSLANSYQDYLRDPARLGEIVSTSVAAMATPVTAGRLDRSRVVPVIKDRKWLDDMRAQLIKEGATKSFAHKVEDFNAHLVIVYAEDDPQRTRYLAAAEDVGVAGAELRALATGNLQRILPKITLESHPDAEFSQLSAGGDYDASLLLLDHIWSSGQIKVDGDIVVAIPARNILLVTGSRSRKGLKVVRAIVAEAMKGSYPLTDVLFVYRNGKFVKFGRT